MGRAKKVFGASLLLLTAACNENKLGTLPSSHSETHYQGNTDEAKVDIVFVVDNSGSMAQEQQKLGENFQSFIDHFVGLGLDYQIAVISTDVENPSESGKFLGTPKILTATTPEIQREFLEAAALGTGGSGAESGLTAIQLALSEPLISTDNAGFLRPEAILAVIIVSDEEDFSDGDNGEPDPAMAPPVSDTVNFLLGLKGGDPAKIMMPVIVGDVPDGCSSPDADAEPGLRYHEAATALNGSKSSICSGDFASILDQIGEDLVGGLVTAFPLAYTPDVTTIHVTVDEIPVPQSETDGWYWSAAVNGVAFAPAALPDACSVIEISYGVTDFGGPIETGNAEAPPESCPAVMPPVDNTHSLDGGLFACTVGGFQRAPGGLGILAALGALALVALRRR